MAISSKTGFPPVGEATLGSLGGWLLEGVFQLKPKTAQCEKAGQRPRPFSPRWVRVFLYGLFWLVGVLLVRPVAFLLSLRAPQRLPPIKNPVLLMRAKDLAEAVRTRKLRSEDVVSAYVARIQEVNPVLNALVDERFEQALQEARDVDKRLDAGDVALRRLPLVGVPVTVKESISVKGLSNLGGKPLQPGEEPLAEADALAVSRLRAAGAIPLCVTNTPESCLWWESYNARTGYTVNPYDTRLTAGGSSGGEGALLGSAASVLGLGSDVAGSCRLPGFFCGVSGHKPTPELVPLTGHAPGCDDPNWPQFFTFGPMARYVSDLPLALEVLAGERAESLRLREKVDLHRVRVFYLESEPSGAPTQGVSAEVRDGQRRAVEFLRAQGMSVHKLDPAGLEDAFGMSALIMLQMRRVQGIHYDPENPDEMKDVWAHLFRFLTCRSRSTLYAVLAGPVFQLSRKLPRGLVKAATTYQTRLRAYLQDLLGDDGVLLYPSGPSQAFPRYQTWYRLMNNSYMMLFNALGLPVTQVPLGLGPSGRPLGLQVVAAKNQDRLTLAIGQELELGLGGWVPPPSKAQS